jgi:tRNA-2-methylthio-N6-dimethylallyladenosine synthase
LSQKDKDTVLSKAGWVDVVMGTHNVHRTVDLLKYAREHGPIVEILEEAVIDDHAMFPSALPAKRETTYNAWVTIQIGCDNSCAFCIVPSVRGKEISRPMDEILDEIRTLAQSGVTEVTLLGQNVNSYGRDLALDARRQGEDRRVRPMFAELLEAVGALEGIRRVRFTSPHPKDMRAETFGAMATTASVCEHLHYPLQSGSDSVLAAMHRGYSAQRYLDRLAEARRMIPDLAVTTDIIVGFPGETEADFQRTMEVAAEACFDSAYEFEFSARPGTEAANMQDRFVDPKVVNERFERLRVVLEHSAEIKHQERVGRIEEVVVEGVSKRNEGVMTGRTRQNKLVHFPSPEPIRVGSYANVLVTSAARHFLRGELQQVTAWPTHKVRLSVSAL